MRNILLFGDSIAVGFNALNQEGWAHHLKKFLEERDTEASLINLAVAGATTEDLLKHFESDCEKHKPSEMVLAIGINDSCYSFQDHRARVPREKFEQNIEQLLTIAQKYAKKLIVIGITRVDERSSTISDDNNGVYQYQNIVIQKYNDSLRGISKNFSATFVDIYGLLSDEELDDGYHPNDAGHRKLFEEVRKVL